MRSPPPFKSSKRQTPLGQQPNSHRAPKRPAKAPIGLRVYAGRSETTLVAHTTLLGISCRGSFPCYLDYRGPVTLSSILPVTLESAEEYLTKVEAPNKDVIVAVNVITYALHCRKLSRQRRDSASNIQRLTDARNVLIGVFCHLKNELRHFDFLRPCRHIFQSCLDGSSYAALRHDYRRTEK